jgi:uncharacterized protein (UPF0332 family)
VGKVEQDFQNCMQEGRILAFGDGPKLAAKQLEIAKGDLAEAKDSIERGRWKWATVQAYYSMFHTARALLFFKGFREKSHRCLRVAVAHLYGPESEHLSRLIDDFQLAKQLRENADYAEDFSEGAARKLAESAGRFLAAARERLAGKG